MKSANPGKNGCGGEGLGGRSESREMILSFLLGAHTMNKSTITREIWNL